MSIGINRRDAAALLAAAPLVAGLPAWAQGARTLTVGVVSDPVTLDPALMASFFELSVQFNLHEPLVNVSPEL